MENRRRTVAESSENRRPEVRAPRLPLAVALSAAAMLALVLSTWGASGVGDIDGNGITNAADLSALLGNWGACP